MGVESWLANSASSVHGRPNKQRFQFFPIADEAYSRLIIISTTEFSATTGALTSSQRKNRRADLLEMIIACCDSTASKVVGQNGA